MSIPERRKRHRARAAVAKISPGARPERQYPPSWFFLLVFLVTIVSYAPAIRGGFIWDDDAHVTRPELQSLHGLWRIWFELGASQQYYPLVHSVFWIEHRLWGDAVIGYHLVNILLHATSACLLAVILTRLHIPGAMLAAAIFALHPVHVESVAWITELKNTLSGLFYLLSMLVYLHFDERRRASVYALALALFVFALLSKTVTATLPAALLLIFWWQRGRLSFRRDVVPLLPWFVLGISFGLLTAWVERKFIGAEGTGFEFSLLQRSLLAGRVACFYLGKLLWPTSLVFMYPRWTIDSSVAWQYAFPLLVLLTIILLWSIRSLARGPLAGVLFFLGTLLPALGFFNVAPFMYSFVADHFQYLASLGIITLISAGVTLGTQHLSNARGGMVAAAVLLVPLALLTSLQASRYANLEILYRYTLDRNPDCEMAHNNLGTILAASGRTQEGIEHYLRAIALNPLSFEAHSNLGNALMKLGQDREAVKSYEAALQARRFGGTPDEARRNLASVLNNLAWIYATTPDSTLRDGGKAVSLAEQAINLYGANEPGVLDTLAAAYAQAGRPADAAAAAERALNLAISRGQSDLATEIAARLKAYRKQLPATQTVPQ